MDYVAWPKTGCSLGEARQRVADRVAWNERLERIAELRTHSVAGALRNGAAAASENQTSDPTGALGDVEARIEAKFRSQLADRQLVAYGRCGHPKAPAQVIGAGDWPTLTRIDWEQSCAREDRPEGRSFVDVWVFPALHAPCRVDLIADQALSEAFKTFVLQDPEVSALAHVAVRLAPESARVFVHGRCHLHGVAEWPTSVGLIPIIDTVHPDPIKRWIYSAGRNPDPLEVIIAAEALVDRFCALNGLLRSGELEARGLPQTPGHPATIPRSVWYHPGYYFNVDGDVLQWNEQPKDLPLDRLTRRWSAVVLKRGKPSGSAIEVVSSSVPFHVKPPAHDPVRGSTTARDGTALPRRSRRAPKAERVAAALAKEGLANSPGDLSHKQVAARIANHMAAPPRTESEHAALTKTVARYYASRRSA